MAKEDRALTTIELMAQASSHHQRGQLQRAQAICERILGREPSHVNALNLSGLILQASGRHRSAATAFAKALARDPWNAACHYNLGASFQALDRPNEAELHFRKAIELGTRLKNVEDLIFQNPAVATCTDSVAQRWPLPIGSDELFSRYSLGTIAEDIFLRCALATVPLHHAPLEKFLTALRTILLHSTSSEHGVADPAVIRLFSALAQQCFLNEYVFAQSDEETRLSGQLRELLVRKLNDGDALPPGLLPAVAAYFPLFSLPGTKALLQRNPPETIADLVHQQFLEPLQEIEDRKFIPALTIVDDDTSRQVMDQYGENPYPRWTVDPAPTLVEKMRPGAIDDRPQAILIAGCGSGQHAVEIARRFPEAQILAVDLSLPSLAYARRRTGEIGVTNVVYAQADILELDAIDRSFDRIEAVGVLHHLAEPERGWEILVSMLRPNGTMRVGLYSEAARRDIAEIRDFIAERGYYPTPQDIRKLRQEILRIYDGRGWRPTIESLDFYNTSGCRDLLFNVVEHRFTIPKIKQFLTKHGLSFLNFDLEAAVIELFQRQFPGLDPLANLDNWHRFEMNNPQTFRGMYQFTIQKN